MRYLTADEVSALHVYLMAEHWREPMYGLRDAGLLESAINRPIYAARYGDADLADQAARLWHGISSNHPFVQGNKRTAYAAMEVFLSLNGHKCTATDDQLIVACLDLATGRMDEKQSGEWLRKHMAPIDACELKSS